MLAGSVNVAWQLRSVETDDDGGLVLLPGTHVANYPNPIVDPGDPLAERIGLIHPRVSAGDAIVFMGAATGHGAWAVGTHGRGRRVAQFSYLSRHEAVAPERPPPPPDSTHSPSAARGLHKL